MNARQRAEAIQLKLITPQMIGEADLKVIEQAILEAQDDERTRIVDIIRDHWDTGSIREPNEVMDKILLKHNHAKVSE